MSENIETPQSDPFAAFGEVEEFDTSTVEISDEENHAFDAAVAHFAARTNRHQLVVTRPDEKSAKLFYRQVKQYAEEHDLSTLPKRDGNTVMFRFAQKRPASDAS